MKHIKLFIIIFIPFGFFNYLSAQNILTKEAVVTMALENNFGIILSKNTSENAFNNTSKYNTGVLPSVGVDAGFNYRVDNVTANFQDGRKTTLNWADSRSDNISIAANYVLFNGFFRKYNIEQLEERYALSKIEVELTMQNVAAQALSLYYQVAALEGNLATVRESIDISAARLNRADEKFNFGQGRKLDILNSQVDLNNDSLAYFNAELSLNNAKRQLNNLIITQNTLEYSVSDEAAFMANLNKDQLISDLLVNNINIAQLDKRIEIGNLSIELVNARKLPTVSTNVNYGYSHSRNNSASFLASQNSDGLNAGLTASWDLFDGGTTRHALAQTKIANQALKIEMEQLEENLLFDLDMSWASYQNALLVYETNVKNLQINEDNFRRTEEAYKIGQLNSVDFRQAQINLLNAATAKNNSKFQVKIAEIELLLLAGKILN